MSGQLQKGCRLLLPSLKSRCEVNCRKDADFCSLQPAPQNWVNDRHACSIKLLSFSLQGAGLQTHHDQSSSIRLHHTPAAYTCSIHLNRNEMRAWCMKAQ
eukprot:TRINITY_DN50135_c1_g1_i3.p1 TRINITY_DN50135_c1_g1~~TRINITY_DN50135_c1_g1_i3.p1  ORF type:complete len:100 (-),score=16.37 TRINITY_DN50135_c1_g1_i3:70-369(-)